VATRKTPFYAGLKSRKVHLIADYADWTDFANKIDQSQISLLFRKKRIYQLSAFQAQAQDYFLNLPRAHVQRCGFRNLLNIPVQDP
jgi:hypothetical protein